MDLNGVTMLEAKTEERPVYFDFPKSDFTSRHDKMSNLTYDPFPDSKSTDVVRREIIGRQVILVAKLKAPAGSIGIGKSIIYKGQKFEFKKVSESFGDDLEMSVFEIEAAAHVTPADPLVVLAKLRDAMASRNETQ